MNDMITRAACEHALRRIAQGDMDGLETIYDKLGRRIYLLAYSNKSYRQSKLIFQRYNYSTFCYYCNNN